MIECLYSWLFSASYATVLAYFYQSSIESLDNWSVYFAISPHVASCCISLGFFLLQGMNDILILFISMYLLLNFLKPEWEKLFLQN